MQPLLAEIRTDAPPSEDRRSLRRALRLEVVVSSRDSNALIHNLSQTGLLIQTEARLLVGERLEFDLPEAGPTPAEVVWTRGEFVGCEVAAPVSRGAVSAALLRAPPERPRQSAPRALWSDLEGLTETEVLQRPEAALAVGLGLALAIAASLVVALLSFPFAV